MFRTSVARSARAILPRRTPTLIFRPSRIPIQIRSESTGSHVDQPPKPRTPQEQVRKEAKDRMNELQHDWDAKEINYSELKPLTENPTSDTYLIDVREPDEVIQGMIPSAVNLPLSVLGNSLFLEPVLFSERHGFEKPKKDQLLIFYCRSGKRSTTASDVAKRNGFTNILNYKGSWLEWVEKENKKN